jgi:hypothetical protein
MMRSAHSTNETYIGTLPHLTPQFVKSASVTARAREHAPQAKTGMRFGDNSSRRTAASRRVDHIHGFFAHQVCHSSSQEDLHAMTGIGQRKPMGKGKRCRSGGDQELTCSSLSWLIAKARRSNGLGWAKVVMFSLARSLDTESFELLYCPSPLAGC